MDSLAQTTIWGVAALTQLVWWSAVIWWDHDIRQKLRYSSWSTSLLLGIPFRLFYSAIYLAALFVMTLVVTGITVGITVLVFKIFGVDVDLWESA